MNIPYLQWQHDMNKITPEDHRIGSDFLVLESGNERFVECLHSFPFKSKETTAILCFKGGGDIVINMKHTHYEAPCMVVLLHDQVFQILNPAEGTESKILVMSKNFLESFFNETVFGLDYLEAFTLNPVINLSSHDVETLNRFWNNIESAVAMRENPYRLEMVKHLILAFFFGYGHLYNGKAASSDRPLTRQEKILEAFLALLKDNYKQHRAINWYADKMCISPRYLSREVMNASGRSPLSWIEDYVCTEAKALLCSTNMTVFQVADALNFETQSLFGKYFHRVVGQSPLAYRKGE